MTVISYFTILGELCSNQKTPKIVNKFDQEYPTRIKGDIRSKSPEHQSFCWCMCRKP